MTSSADPFRSALLRQVGNAQRHDDDNRCGDALSRQFGGHAPVMDEGGTGSRPFSPGGLGNRYGCKTRSRRSSTRARRGNSDNPSVRLQARRAMGSSESSCVSNIASSAHKHSGANSLVIIVFSSQPAQRCRARTAGLQGRAPHAKNASPTRPGSGSRVMHVNQGTIFPRTAAAGAGVQLLFLRALHVRPLQAHRRGRVPCQQATRQGRRRSAGHNACGTRMRVEDGPLTAMW